MGNRILYLLFLLWLTMTCAWVCAGDRGLPSDFHVTYTDRSGFLGYVNRIDILPDSIYLYSASRLRRDTIDERIAVAPERVRGLYAFLDSLQILSLASPPHGRYPDAPEEEILVTYGGRSCTLSIGGRENLPVPLADARSSIITFADSASRRWRHEVR